MNGLVVDQTVVVTGAVESVPVAWTCTEKMC